MLRSTHCSRMTLLLAALLSLANAARAEVWSVRDLGTLGGPTSAAFGVNDLGQVAGASTRADAAVRAFSWFGAETAIAPLAGDTQSQGFAVNNAGQLAAASYTLGAMVSHGEISVGGVSTSIGNIAPRAINSSGAVAGFLNRLDPNWGWMERPAYCAGSSVTELPTLGGDFGFAAGLNDAGWIVGWSFTAADDVPRATLWLSGVATDLGTLGGPSAQAYAINSADRVAGVADTAAGDPHACVFVLDPTTGAVASRTDLGVLGGGYSYAYAINANNIVVGASDARATLWRSGSTIDLNTLLPAGSHWRLDAAWAINDQSQIAGLGLHNGQPRAFLMTPTTVLVGDLNCDGFVNNGDIDPFVLALTNGSAYHAAYPNCNLMAGDINGDGLFNNGDIDPFVVLLTGG